MPTSDPSIVQPAADAAPAPAPVEAAPGNTPTPDTAAPAPKGEIPEDVLRIPAMGAIMAGNPPAFSLNFETSSQLPEVKLLGSAKESLMGAGIGFYAVKSGGLGVVFNALKIKPEAVKAADDAGQLAQIAPDFQSLNSSVASSGAANPVLQGGQDASAMAAPMSGPSGGSAMPAPQAASAQAKMASARAKNMQPGSPTSGAKPGSGRLLNAILKPAV